ncbi:ROK family protein [Caenibacillus caldisaponilyticus]|uniref:ROK family protein n=1 Tax=Caenibacillus caldisaponilyticus TaxID=1674942 RepID=UPI0009885119|nr:ROK family protein [Caenibacillus caldisaponilyticus]
MALAVGIDIGGTKTAIALVKENGDIVESAVIPTEADIAPDLMIDKMIAVLNDILRKAGVTAKDVAGIGIGAPGVIDLAKGEFTFAPNLPWRDVPIVARFSEAFPVPVRLGNDANVAALAEKWLGAARECDHFIYITISTGIGGGIYLNGKLYTGSRGNAGEIGHIVVEHNGRTCGCGQKGCFEAVASGTAIAKIGSELAGRPLSTKEVFDLYFAGDPVIKPFVEDVFNKIGAGCTSLINLFEPEMIVLGGGVTNVGTPLFDAVKRYVSEHAISPAGRATAIVPSQLSQNTGVIGAAALILKNGE